MDKITRESVGPYPPNRLKELRDQRGLSQGKVAEMVVPASSAQMVGMLENRHRELTQTWMERLARALGCRPRDLLPDDVDDHDSVTDDGATVIPVAGMAGFRQVMVIGEVQAGAFKEHPEWPRHRHKPIPFEDLPDLRRYPLFGVKVIGSSMDREFPEGTVAICVRLLDLGEDFEIDPGRYVVVYRRNEQDEIEATLKQFEVDTKGEPWLWPRSDDPEHQQPIRVRALVHSEDFDMNDEVQIWALVVGKTQTYGF